MTVADGFNFGVGLIVSVGFMYLMCVMSLAIFVAVSKLWRK